LSHPPPTLLAVPTLTDLAHEHADLDAADLDWLHLLVGDWQLISDLSFADLVLWLPVRDGSGFVAVAHCRPSTGATVHSEDVVGRRLPRGRSPQVDAAYDTGRICRERDPEWLQHVPRREETIPVVRSGRTVAVMARETNLAAARTPSRLELTYLRCADDLALMVAGGEFPVTDTPTGPRRGAPRVGDGMVRLDVEGVVTYASPNALSAFHRLGMVGELVDRSLAEVATSLVEDRAPVDESLALVVMGRAPWRTDLEYRGTVLSLRAVPLRHRGERTGALVLVRDVSELRRRERELLTKDATIREIHHRVKNNLQTVAALLRLQARRIDSADGRAALEEAMRRVATIAVVHQILSQRLDETVEFDDVVQQVLQLTADVASPSASVRTVREGHFGPVGAQDATPLALVLTELVTNAVEHGLGARGGTVVVRAERDGDALRVVVSDDGAGMPAGGTGRGSGLGMRIVHALVEGELRGRIAWQPNDAGGTDVVLDTVLREVGR
jgi:two-component system, sensor histidine kinase PdtaS